MKNMRSMMSQELSCFSSTTYLASDYDDQVGVIGKDDHQISSNAASAAAAPLMMSFLSDEGQLCSICLEGLKNYEKAINGDDADSDEEANYEEMPRTHKFHSPCIQTWLAGRTSCQLCRGPIETAMPMMPVQVEEDDEIARWRNIATTMDQLWHFDICGILGLC